MAPNLSTLQPLSVGDVILDIKPVIHVILRQLKGIYCDRCLRRNNSLKKCSNCHQMYYCGRNCQRNDWKYHKNECKVFVHNNFKAKECTDEEMLLIRLWLTIQSDPGFATRTYRLPNGSDVCLKDIEINFEEIMKDIDFLVEFYPICNHFKDYGLKFDDKELLRLYGMVRYSTASLEFESCSPTNEWEIFDWSALIVCVGLGIYPQMSSVGHSCVPNSGVVTIGLSLQLRALTPIAVGTILTRNLVVLDQNKTQRLNDLKRRFFISHCNCLKCELNLDSNIDYEKFSTFRNTLFVKYQDLVLQATVQRNGKPTVDWSGLQLMAEDLFSVSKQIFGEYHLQRTSMMAIWLIFLHAANKMKKLSLEVDPNLYEEVKRHFSITHSLRHACFIFFDSTIKLFSRKFD